MNFPILLYRLDDLISGSCPAIAFWASSILLWMVNCRQLETPCRGFGACVHCSPFSGDDGEDGRKPADRLTSSRVRKSDFGRTLLKQGNANRCSAMPYWIIRCQCCGDMRWNDRRLLPARPGAVTPTYIRGAMQCNAGREPGPWYGLTPRSCGQVEAGVVV